MKRDMRITILKSEVDKNLAEKYAIPNFGSCPFHKAGQIFISDGNAGRMACARMHGSP